MKSFEKLTDETDGTGGIGAWIPSEHYADLILEGVYRKGQLAGKITALNYDMNAGNGNTVNVRYVAVRDNVQEIDSCVTGSSCLSAASTTFGDYTITVKMQGDYDIVCDFAMWQSTGDGYAQIAKAMSDSLAQWRDLKIWEDLAAATANTTITSTCSYNTSRTTDTCCNFCFDIYNAIIDGRQHLLGDGYDPDYVIIHPYVASYLYYKENGNTPAVQDIMPLVKYDGNGYLASIAGLKVIEAKVAVVDDSEPTAGGDELAFVIDSSRALGEVWGKRPTFTKEYVPECNNYKMVVWTYWGHDQLDQNAIVAIENP
jgi:hypothetical protein